MSTLSELIAGVRLALEYPLPGVLTDEKILDKLSDSSQLMLLEAQNTGISWCVNKFDLQVGIGQPDYGYILPAPDFAKDIMVRTCDPSDPFHVSREITRVSPQDVDQYYAGPETTTAGPLHTAVCVTVHRVGGMAYMKFFPAPYQNAIYRIWYETGSFPSQDLGTEPFLPPFHTYLKLRAAVSCLPKCKWQGNSREQDTQMRQELALGIAPDLSDYTHAFRVWITSDRIESVTRRVGFGDYFERSTYDSMQNPGVVASSATFPSGGGGGGGGGSGNNRLLLNDGSSLLLLDDGFSGLILDAGSAGPPPPPATFRFLLNDGSSFLTLNDGISSLILSA